MTGVVGIDVTTCVTSKKLKRSCIMPFQRHVEKKLYHANPQIQV